MACQRDVIYWYDGTFEGFLCCVFESYANREIPWDIWYYATRQSSLFPGVDVQTDMVRAQRVLKSIREKLGQRVYYMVVRGFLNGEEGKEIRLLRFLRLMYDKGPQAAYQTGAPEVAEYIGDSWRTRICVQQTHRTCYPVKLQIGGKCFC